MMVSSLTRQVRSLLHSQRVASLGTLNDDGSVLVSMVPFAVERSHGWLVIHVSRLAPHAHNLQARSRVSMMVMRPEVPGEPVHALPRVSFDALANLPASQSEPWQACRTAYTDRFPEAEFLTELPDFRFVAIEVKSARQVAGFGSARFIEGEELQLALSPES
jgi:heme iron utilization protein